MNVKLLTKQHLEFLGPKGGCTGSSESTLVKIPHCLKSHVVAHFKENDKVVGSTLELSPIFSHWTGTN